MKQPLLALSLSALPLLPCIAQSGPPRPVMVPSLAPTQAGSPYRTGAASLSQDGRSVVFHSDHPTLVTNRDHGAFLDVFVRNLADGQTTLVSASTNGAAARGNSTEATPSANGRRVAFTSDANDLLAGDTNLCPDVFLRDLDSGQLTLISLAAAGGPANGPSSSPALSPDGQRVAFASTATNLVNADTNRLADVFVRDLATGSTRLVSRTSQGEGSARGISGAPVWSANGQRLAFVSTATNLTDHPGRPEGDVYVHDLLENRTSWAGRNAQNLLVSVTNTPNRKIICYGPSLSADGRYVAFLAASYAGPVLVLRHDLQTDSTDLLSADGLGNLTGADDGGGVTLSADGRVAAFVARTNAPAGSPSCIMIWRQDSGPATAASLTADGALPLEGHSEAPTLSPDGRFLAFRSQANLLADSPAGAWDLYVRDLATGTLRSAQAWTHGDLQLEGVPQIGADGQSAVFATWNEARRGANLFHANLNDPTNPTPLSTPHPAAPPRLAIGWSASEPLSVTPDGTAVAFSSQLDRLAPGDTNELQDVFVRTFPSESIELVSATPDLSSGNGWSGSAAISQNARFVAFVSQASNLAGPDTNRTLDVYLRDRHENRTYLVSQNRAASGSGNRGSWAPSLSADGRYVAFLSMATDLTHDPVPTFRTNAFLWDRTVQQSLLLTPQQTALPPLVAPDGRRVVFQTAAVSGAILQARDIDTGQLNTFGPFLNAATPFTLSPNGRFAALRPAQSVVAWDLLSGSSRSLALPPGDHPVGVRGAPAVSDDGRWVAFTTTAAWPGLGDTNLATDVFQHDFELNVTRLLSGRPDGVAGDRASDKPTMSADGRWAAFRTRAGNLGAPTEAGDPAVLLVDRQTGSRTVVAPMDNASGSERASHPVLNAHGSLILLHALGLEDPSGRRSEVAELFYCHITPEDLADVDHDGMHDFWEQHHFGDLSRDGSSDADHDGLPDLAEYRAGTDPNDPDSFFRARELHITPAGAQLEWDAAPGRTYRVEYQDDLALPAWQALAAPMVVAGGRAHVSDPSTPPNGRRYYRVQALAP